MPIFEPIEINSNSQELIRGFSEKLTTFTAFNSQNITHISYAGKIIDGKPTFTENVKLPENTNILIMIEIKENEKPKFASKLNLEEIEKRRAMVKSLKGCLTDVEINLDEIRKERMIKKGFLE